MIYKKLVASAHKTGTDLVFTQKQGQTSFLHTKQGQTLFLNFILTQKTAFQIEKQSNQVQMKSLRFKRGRDWKSAKRPPQRSET